MMDQREKIEKLIVPALDALGYELVRVQVQGGKRVVLQIMAERRDLQPMKVEDCARISRDLSTHLDEADPIAGDYVLEVSSPGIDRPLVKPTDYERFVGHEAKLETQTPIDGRKRFQGVIAGIRDEQVVLELDSGAALLPLNQIRRAKLVLTDRLIAAALDTNAAGFVGEGDAAPQIHV